QCNYRDEQCDIRGGRHLLRLVFGSVGSAIVCFVSRRSVFARATASRCCGDVEARGRLVEIASVLALSRLLDPGMFPLLAGLYNREGERLTCSIIGKFHRQLEGLTPVGR